MSNDVGANGQSIVTKKAAERSLLAPTCVRRQALVGLCPSPIRTSHSVATWPRAPRALLHGHPRASWCWACCRFCVFPGKALWPIGGRKLTARLGRPFFSVRIKDEGSGR